MKKRIFALLLAVILMVLAIPPVYAANAVCKIGSTEYSSFSSAVTAANNASGNVTIELLKDISISEVEFNGNAGKRITIRGNGKTITTSGGNNALKIYCDMSFYDFTIIHKNWGSAFQILSGRDVLIEDVFLDASDEVKRNFTLVNTMGRDAKCTLTLNNVDIEMSCNPSTSNGDLSAIRTGNAGGDVEITLNNCNIDVSKSTDTCAIHVPYDDTVAKVELRNTHIIAKEYAIKANNQTFDLYESTYTSILDGYFINDPNLIVDGGNVTIRSQPRYSHIYGTQSTPVKNGKHDVRFIAAIKKEDIAVYDSIEIYVEASFGETVYLSETFSTKTVYETLSNISVEGYYLTPAVVEDLSVKTDNTYFNVKLYGKKGSKTTLLDAESFTYKNGAHVVDKLNAADHSIKRADLSARYLLISDIHYTLSEQTNYVNRVTFRGYHTDDRMLMMCQEITEEYYRRGLDAIFVLGDLSTDDYPTRHTNINYCDQVYDKYLKPLSDKLGIPVLIIAGNHDSYPNNMWKEIAGTDRQFVWENTENGDVFILLDSYDPAKGSLATGGGGNPWTGIDEEWLEAQLEKYKNRENVFLATHYFERGTSCYDQLVGFCERYPNITAMFDAHSHRYSSSKKLSNDKWIINTGAYSYDCVKNERSGKWDFDNINVDNLWGFHILEVTDDSVISYRIDTEHTYRLNPNTVWNPDQFTLREYYTPYVKSNEIIHK